MSESCDKPVCQNNVCDRRTAYSLFQDMQNVITRNLQLIAVELKRAQNYKSHPHSVVFRIRVNLSQPLSRDGDVEAYASESRQTRQTVEAVQPFIIDRAVEVISRIQDERPVENVRIVEGVLEACLVFQIAVRSLVDLQGYIYSELSRFNSIHSQYDELLGQYETATANNDSDGMNDLAGDISRMQNRLDGQRLVLQRLVNQIPFTIAPVRNENDFMDIYNRVDDTVVIHNFIESEYVQGLLKKTPALRRVFERLRHTWQDFHPNAPQLPSYAPASSKAQANTQNTPGVPRRGPSPAPRGSQSPPSQQQSNRGGGGGGGSRVTTAPLRAQASSPTQSGRTNMSNMSGMSGMSGMNMGNASSGAQYTRQNLPALPPPSSQNRSQQRW